MHDRSLPSNHPKEKLFGQELGAIINRRATKDTLNLPSSGCPNQCLAHSAVTLQGETLASDNIAIHRYSILGVADLEICFSFSAI